jgi:hypothetical protein
MKHAFKPLLRAIVPMAAAIALAGVATAPARADADLNAPPSSTLAKGVAQQGEGSGRADSVAPVLHNIFVSGSVNAQQPNQSIIIDMDMTDKSSGIVSYTVELTSPSGSRIISRTKTVPTPSQHVTPTLTVGSYPYSDPVFNVYDQPGTWRVSSLLVQDAAGNARSYNAAQLQGFGNTAFTVINNGGFDIVPPTFAGGTILTPNVHRSKAPKGTRAGTPPYVSANIELTDSGNGATSGDYEAVLRLCHLDTSGQCDDYLTMQAVTNEVGGQANTMTVGTQMRADQTLGLYVIDDLNLYDVASNHSLYTSTQFGGNTNFSSYFPQGTTIFINQ